MEASNLQQKASGYAEKRYSAMGKTANIQIIVATLIATITFAAGLTMPGGYDNRGMTLLRKKPAFWAFIVADSTAFVCSVASLVAYTAMLDLAAVDSVLHARAIVKHFYYAVIMLHVSVVAVVVAFMTGLYSVLVHHSTASSVCVFLSICLCVACVIAYPVYINVEASGMKTSLAWFWGWFASAFKPISTA